MGSVTVYDPLPDGDPDRLTDDQRKLIEHRTKEVDDDLHAILQRRARTRTPVTIGVSLPVPGAIHRYEYDGKGHPTRACIEVAEPLTDEQLAQGWKVCTERDKLRRYGVC